MPDENWWFDNLMIYVHVGTLAQEYIWDIATGD